MITDCDFVCNTEYVDLCVYSNESCIGKDCEIYKNGLTVEDLRNDYDSIQEIRSMMNR